MAPPICNCWPSALVSIGVLVSILSLNTDLRSKLTTRIWSQENWYSYYCWKNSAQESIRRWVDNFVSNEGKFSDSQQDHYIRNNTLMTNEDLCEKARTYVRENAAQQGRSNLTLYMYFIASYEVFSVLLLINYVLTFLPWWHPLSCLELSFLPLSSMVFFLCFVFCLTDVGLQLCIYRYTQGVNIIYIQVLVMQTLSIYVVGMCM